MPKVPIIIDFFSPKIRVITPFDNIYNDSPRRKEKMQDDKYVPSKKSSSDKKGKDISK